MIEKIRIDALNPTVVPQRDHEFPGMRSGISNKIRIEQILSLLETGDIPNGSVTLAKLAADARAAQNHTIATAIADLLGLDPADRNVEKAIEAVAARDGKLLREVFYLFDHIAGVSAPDNSGTAKYIRLTAGQSGAGGYNEGLLTNESVSGSAPLVEATAEIATGPLAGQIVPLINTEEASLRARETSGVLQMDQMQGHHHRLRGSGTAQAGSNFVGGMNSTNDDPTVAMSFFGADGIISDGSNGTPRTGSETRSKNRSATAYMRIV